MTGTLRGVSNKHCLLSFFHWLQRGPKTLHNARSSFQMMSRVLESVYIYLLKNIFANRVSAFGSAASLVFGSS